MHPSQQQPFYPNQPSYSGQQAFTYQSFPIAQPFVPSYVPVMSAVPTHSYIPVTSQLSSGPGGGAGINNRYKTQLCRHYESQKYCHLGDRCSFAHGTQDLRKPYDPLPPGASAQPMSMGPKATYSNYKTIQCRFYEQGTCKYGDNCTYAHGDDRRSQTDPLPPSSSVYVQPTQQGGFYGGSYPLAGPLENMSTQEAPEEVEQVLDVIHREIPVVKEKLHEIREMIDNGDQDGADAKIWSLYTEGYIVEVKRYQKYQENMQKQQAMGSISK